MLSTKTREEAAKADFRRRAPGNLLARLLDLVAAPGTGPGCHRLAAHLTTELPAIFGFLFDRTLDATNWRAEQALRRGRRESQNT